MRLLWQVPRASKTHGAGYYVSRKKEERGGFTLKSSTKCKNAYALNINDATCKSLAPRMGNRPPIAGEVKVAPRKNISLLVALSIAASELVCAHVWAVLASFFFSVLQFWFESQENLTAATDSVLNCQPARHRLITEDREVLVAHQGVCEVAEWKCNCWTTSSASLQRCSMGESHIAGGVQKKGCGTI